MNTKELLQTKKGLLIGMVHCLPLPGTLDWNGSMDVVISKAISDAKILEKAGFDAVLVEPTLDRPSGYKRETLQVAAMTAICEAVRQAVSIPMGVSFFTPDPEAVLCIAKASGSDFVRISVFVDEIVFPTGRVMPCATRAWEIKNKLDLKDISIFADIQVKHGKMADPTIPLEKSAILAQLQGADAVIVTGTTTGEETPLESMKAVKKVVKIPVIAGSGVSSNNIKEQMQFANGFIVGSSIKKDGKLVNPVDLDLALNLVKERNNG